MKKYIGLTAVAVIIAGAGYLYHRASAANADTMPAPPSAFEVEALVVKRGPVIREKEYAGRVTAYKISEVRPQINGLITKRLFEEGSDVKEGDQLYQIDDAPSVAALNSAKADLQKAQANYKSVQLKAARYAELVKIDGISKQEYDDVVASQDQAKADIAIAKAAVDTAQINVNYTKVYAPIAGRVGISTVTEGALVTANQTQPLSTITQLDPVYVDMTGAAADLNGLRPSGDAAKREVWLYPDDGDKPYAQTGDMKFSDVTVNETTGTVQLRAVFPNPDHTLLPGQFVKARIRQEDGEGLLIPQSAAIRGADSKLTVWVVGTDSKVTQKPVTATDAVGNQWRITDGLTEGDVIVTAGFQKIKAGDTVKVAVTPPVKSK